MKGKGTAIYQIGLLPQANLNMDWVIFEDSWIVETDILMQENGNTINMLEYKLVEETILVYPELIPYNDPWRVTRLSAARFNKETISKLKKGDIIYVNNI